MACITDSVQVPFEIQLKVAISDCRDGKDTSVSAGTGSSVTLLIALDVLLDVSDKQLISVTISPLKHLRLEMTQESDFNTRHGSPWLL
jgi:hypothetical protein